MNLDFPVKTGAGFVVLAQAEIPQGALTGTLSVNMDFAIKGCSQPQPDQCLEEIVPGNAANPTLSINAVRSFQIKSNGLKLVSINKDVWENVFGLPPINLNDVSQDSSTMLRGTSNLTATSTSDGFTSKVTQSPLPDQSVKVEIKPGETGSPINLGANGCLPVALLSDPSFDTTKIAPKSVTVAGAPICNANADFDLEDVNSDGLTDLVTQVDNTALQLAPGDSFADVEAQTFVGQPVFGVEAVTVK